METKTPKSLDSTVHKNHRQRLRQRYMKNGIESLEEARMLEMLLFYSIPVKDTYMTAHALLQRFGSVYNVFRADVKELCKIDGVGQKTAEVIHFFGDAMHSAVLRKTEEGDFSDRDKLKFYLIWKLSACEVDTTVVMYLDRKYRLLDCINYATPENSYINIYEDINNHVKNKKAYKIVVAHKHPSGNTDPSYTDIVNTETLLAKCKESGIELLEHYVISDFTAHGILENDLKENDI